MSLYKTFYKNNNNIFYLFLITIISNLIWFLYYPAYRFGIFYNLVLIFFLLVPFWKNIILNNKLNKFFSRGLIFVALLFFIYENIERIDDQQNKYGNIWPPINNKYEIINKF